MRGLPSVPGGRSFRCLLTASAVSMLGSAVAPIALAFGVLGLPGGSATALGLVMSARAVAQVLLLLFGGVLADRLSRPLLLVTSSLVAGAAQAGTAALLLAHRGPVAALAALAALLGAANAVFLPASRGLVPELVPREGLPAANGLLRLSRNVSLILGTSLGGVLVVAFGPGPAVAVDAASFVVAAVVLLGARTAAPRPVTIPADAAGPGDTHPAAAAVATNGADDAGAAPTRRPGLFAELREGWQEFRSRRWVWVVVAQFAVVNVCFGPTVNVLGPVLATRHLHGAAGWSTALTAQSIGLVGGSVLALRLRPRYPLRVAVRATFGFLPPFLFLAVGAPLPLVAASLLVNGVCVDVFEVLWDTTLQTHLPTGVISRVSAYDTLGSFVLGPVGLAVVGPLSALVGVTTTVAGAGVLLASANLAAALTPDVRDLPAEPASS